MTNPSELHGVLVVDKARGPTSHNVVSLARRALGTRAIGHSGTLDPMATGVLVLVVGEATKLVNLLMAGSKIYEATLRLGTATSSLDADGEVVQERPVPALTIEAVREAAQKFVGKIEQVVPAVSAVKVDGRPLYVRARKGQEVVAPTRTVEVHELAILALRGHEIDLRVHCSKGFYVRSLGRDLAHALCTVGHLSALRRIQNGPFSLQQAFDQARLRAAAQGDEEARRAAREGLLPLAQVARGLSHVILSDEGARHAFHGRRVPQSEVQREVHVPEHEGDVRVAFDAAGHVLALVEPDPSGGGLRVVRGIRAS